MGVLPLIAMIKRSGATDLSIRSDISTLLQVNCCPPMLWTITAYLHNNMNSAIKHNGSSSKSSQISSGVEEGNSERWLLPASLLLILQHTSIQFQDGILLTIWICRITINFAIIQAKSGDRGVFFREMLSADDAALIAHKREHSNDFRSLRRCML